MAGQVAKQPLTKRLEDIIHFMLAGVLQGKNTSIDLENICGDDYLVFSVKGTEETWKVKI